MTVPSSYPLVLEPRFDPKIWGGRRLQSVLGKRLSSDDRFGESLESDDSSRVVNGPLAGVTIAELLDQDRAGILGIRGIQASQPIGGFPLLAKFIDASEVLSVQVHPNDTEAAPLNKRGKTEAWHIIHAEPGATLVTGVMSNASIDQIDAAIRDVRLGELIVEEPVSSGETYLVPAGTTHAIGAGILLYEIQQASDVTFRMYDWGRLDDHGNPRDLHVRESLEVVKTDLKARRISSLELDETRQVLAACRYFALERWDVENTPMRIALDGQSFRLLSCIRGDLSLDGADQRLDIRVGHTVLLPASISSIQLSGAGSLLVSYIPDLDEDIREPLLQRGHAPEEIARLSGDLTDLE